MNVEIKHQGTEKKIQLTALISQNVRSARKKWAISADQAKTLTALTQEFQLSLALGDLSILDGKWHVTHSGLMRLARRKRCAGIRTHLVRQFCDPASARWVFCAIVFKSRLSKRFVGHGDADPSNVSPLVRGAEMRIAETRAVNRALRKAYGVGLCSVEELGSFSSSPSPTRDQGKSQKPQPQGGSNNGHTRLRDRLCLLIRQYNLDPNLVKAYAADFCGTETLRGASRDLVESFITHITASALENRDGLVCKLNSYAQPVEVSL